MTDILFYSGDIYLIIHILHCSEMFAYPLKTFYSTDVY